MNQFKTPQEWRRSSEYQDISLAGQFTSIVREILKAGPSGPNWEALTRKFESQAHSGRAESFCKAAVGAVADDLWQTSDGEALSAAYLTTLAPDNLVDQVARYAFPMPVTNQPVFYATGAVAEEVAEGAGKPLTRFTLEPIEEQPAKVAAIIVVTNEVAQSPGLAAENLIRRLLRDAVLKASNERLLAQLPKVSTSGGETAVESLRLGLAKAAASDGYVVAATDAIVRELALASDGRMGVNGGEFIPGVTIVRALEESSSSHNMTIIPASTLALRDYGLEVRSSGHATVEMQSAPTGNSATPTGAEMVNLWQTNSRGILIERHFSVRADSPAIEVI